MRIQEYIDSTFKPFINSQLESVRKIDIDLVVYLDDSLKNATREKRDLEHEERYFRQITSLQTGKASFV